jgi:lipoate-protein ligase A
MRDADVSPTDAQYSHAIWRLVIHPPQEGALNMAIDEAIAEGVAAGGSKPTLRLYAWQPACLSLGRSQPGSDADLARLHARGWDIVRRPTGGRAILHVDEITYSIAVRATDPRVAGNVVESYRRLSAGLLCALRGLGLAVSADPGTAESRHFRGPICFEEPSDYEITFGGKKLIGSAQSRREGMVLQHGSFPLTGDITRICEALAFPDEAERVEARTRLATRATQLEEALGEPVDAGRVAAALVAGFSTALNLTFEEGTLTESEQRRAEVIRAEKYAADHWTFRS